MAVDIKGVEFDIKLLRGVQVILTCPKCNGDPFTVRGGRCFYCNDHGFVHATIGLDVLKQVLAGE